jgi:hypothetical protein
MPTIFRSLNAAVANEVEAIRSGRTNAAHLASFEAAGDPLLLEGVLFLKPEATMPGVALGALLNTLADYIEQWDLQLGGVSVLGAEYLKEHDIIARHYGVINSISRTGPTALGAAAQAKLREFFGSELDAGAEVVGAHQYLEKHPQRTAAELNDLVDKLGFKKLAPGTYALKYEHEGTTTLLLNAFHPQQLEHFTASGRSIVVLALRAPATRPEMWKALRNEMLGPTDPAAGVAGAMRRVFLERSAELGLGEVNRGTNVVHFSAGPLEGMVETVRYFSDYESGILLSYNATCFAGLLRAAGVSGNDVEWLATNPNLALGDKQISAFDATEELDPQPAVEVLQQGLAAR